MLFIKPFSVVLRSFLSSSVLFQPLAECFPDCGSSVIFYFFFFMKPKPVVMGFKLITALSEIVSL